MFNSIFKLKANNNKIHAYLSDIFIPIIVIGLFIYLFVGEPNSLSGEYFTWLIVTGLFYLMFNDKFVLIYGIKTTDKYRPLTSAQEKLLMQSWCKNPEIKAFVDKVIKLNGYVSHHDFRKTIHGHVKNSKNN